MRSRATIEETFKDITVPMGQGNIKLELELLLDIRELLMAMNDREMLVKITKERIRAEQERMMKVAEKSDD